MTTPQRPKRHHRTESKSSPRRILAKQRHAQALQMRMDGLSFDAIAKQLGYADAPGAYEAVKRALAAIPAAEAAQYRALNVERLNQEREGFRARLAPGEKERVALELSVQEREANYLGLDAPRPQPLPVSVYNDNRSLTISADVQQLVALLDCITPALSIEQLRSLRNLVQQQLPGGQDAV